MGHTRDLPELASIVELLRGRDSKKLAVVIGHDGDRFVWVADGDLRKVEKPKRKNILHIRTLGSYAERTRQTLQEGKQVSNAMLRYDLRRYSEAGQEENEVHG
ncbi:hypothetical protein ACOJUR_02920 [Alicyclobacillus tolerans]|uniref:Ribosomal protein L14E/L6E/L27E n=2 Tax=Alicyclobacillus tolerans TaxID=90970 RepID=A0A1M6VH03_9BACL|nr:MULTISPECIES: KOW domain-containing RNA-binding protein [Alicyclobacillus]MDP9728524.1 ribosomal protein L14E/L6E/L27E [Alicyclobacillus tengchongensis]QRF22524.1 hypothetical protein FY534_01620 [Alicyclobacillus sp. TC]SHK80748.1 hypothetical protein SAMN05443507_12317 [Alicyclobacillus montanus]